MVWVCSVTAAKSNRSQHNDKPTAGFLSRVVVFKGMKADMYGDQVGNRRAKIYGS